jgi:hypothetical protein
MAERRSWMELVEILRVRFDAYSARAVLDESLEAAGVAKKATYVASEIESVASVLARRRDRLEPVVARLLEEARAASFARAAG